MTSFGNLVRRLWERSSTVRLESSLIEGGTASNLLCDKCKLRRETSFCSTGWPIWKSVLWSKNRVVMEDTLAPCKLLLISRIEISTYPEYPMSMESVGFVLGVPLAVCLVVMDIWVVVASSETIEALTARRNRVAFAWSFSRTNCWTGGSIPSVFHSTCFRAVTRAPSTAPTKYPMISRVSTFAKLSAMKNSERDLLKRRRLRTAARAEGEEHEISLWDILREVIAGWARMDVHNDAAPLSPIRLCLISRSSKLVLKRNASAKELAPSPVMSLWSSLNLR